MTTNRYEKSSSPLAQATDIRHSLLTSIEQNLPIELTISSQVMACLLLMPTRIFNENNFQILIVNTPDHKQIIKADHAEIAMQAFRNWRDDLSDQGKNSYNKTLYQSLYELVQAAALNVPPEVVDKLPALLLMLEAERDRSFTYIAERFAQMGDLDNEDARIVHAYLRKIWSKLPQGAKDKLEHPDNLFNI